MIDGGARDVLAESDPLAAETWASHLLGTFDSARLAARLPRQEVPPFEEAILQRCAERRDQRALVVATALAAVLPPPLDEQARGLVAGLRQSTHGPPWLDGVGLAEPARAWLATDVFGDQDTLIVGLAQPGATRQHAVVALVDHNVSGQAKDAWLGEDVDHVVAAWSSNEDPHMRLEEMPVEAVLARLRDAMAASDRWDGDTALRTEDFANHRALVWAHLRRAGHGDTQHPRRSEVPQAERDALVADFLASEPMAAARTALSGQDIELLAHHLVGLRCDYEGRPLRWSPTVVALLLTDLAPRKLLLDSDQAAALPAVLRAFVLFAGERTGLEPDFVDEILATVDEAEPKFLELMGDPAAAGPAKAVLAALRARGVPLDDPDAIAAALDNLGPLTFLQPTPRAPRPKPADAPPEVVAVAERAPVLTRFAALVDFYGDGRKLTGTGQPTLADARALVSLLGTDDRMDETIGSRTFKTTSAAELPELGFTVRWAIAAGTLRKQHGKLRATAAWRKLHGKPVERWVKAADALAGVGPLAGFYSRAREGFRQLAELVDELVPDLLHSLRSAPMSFDAALDVICAEADETFEWRGYWTEPDVRHRSFGRDLDMLLRILGWAGIVERVDATVEPDQWDAKRERLVGGRLELTAVGQWWLGAERAPVGPPAP